MQTRRVSQQFGHHSDFGSYRIPKEYDDVSVGSRSTFKRARRVDPLEGISLTQGQRQAAMIYRQAVEHVTAGIGMGPLPWGRDVQNRLGSPYSGSGLGPQERALSAADWLRRASVAIPAACQPHGVLACVVVAGWSLRSYDRWRRWTDGNGAVELRTALEACARAFGTL